MQILFMNEFLFRIQISALQLDQGLVLYLNSGRKALDVAS